MNSNNPPVVVGVAHLGHLGAATLRYVADEALVRGTGIQVVHGRANDLDLAAAEGVLAPLAEDYRWEHAVDDAVNTLRQMTADQVAITIDAPMMTGEQALVHASASASLVVVERQPGNALGRLVAGSTASTVAAQAVCPVVVTHAGSSTAEIKAVIVGLDDRGHGQQALAAAVDEASRRRLPLIAAQAWLAAVDRPPYVGYVPTDDDPVVRVVRDNARRSLAEAVAGLEEDYPDVEIRQVLLHGDPVESLVAEAGQSALLVVARHSSHHLASVGLGHVARSLIGQAHCPVMVTAAKVPTEHPRHSRRHHQGATNL